MLLRPSRRGKTDENGNEQDDRDRILFVDPGIATAWNVKLRDVKVLGSTTLASLPPGGLTDPHIVGGEQLIKAHAWTAKDVFTDRLVVLDRAQALPGGTVPKGATKLQLQNRPVTPLLPIRADVLTYLLADDVARRISFETAPEGVVVTFQVPLSGGDGRGRDYEIRRTYSTKDKSIVRLLNPPLMEVWPNFVTADGSWRKYFSLYIGGDDSSFHARPFPIPSADNRRSSRNARGQIEMECHRLTSFPEALVCDADILRADGGGVAVSQVGIIALTQPDAATPATKEWKVGVDFGTSGTNVYYRDEPNVPEPITFRNRLATITAAGTKRDELHQSFLSAVDERTPFLSLFHTFAAVGNNVRPLLDGHVYFLRDHLEKASLREGRVAADLKWGTDRNLTNAFLSQIAFQIAAEARAGGVKAIDWRFGFPTAFSTTDASTLKSTWETICANVGSETGVALLSVSSQTEAVAAARFFAKHEKFVTQFASRGAICLDIGGGTTDISVWQGEGNALRFQTSLRLAGRDLILAALRENPRVLGLFDVEVDHLVAMANDENALYPRLNAVLVERGGQILERLPLLARDPNIGRLIRVLAVGLAGLMFYCGIVVRDMRARGVLTGSLPDVLVGGNGANMLHWLSFGRFRDDAPAAAFLRSMLAEGSGLAGDDSTLILSPTPKAEVARGLVVADDVTFATAGAGAGVAAGEPFVVGGKEQASGTPITSDSLTGGIALTKRGLPELEAFLTGLAKHASAAGVLSAPLTPRNIRITTEQVSQELQNLTGKSPEAIRVEPIFIMAVKALLRIEASKALQT